MPVKMFDGSGLFRLPLHRANEINNFFCPPERKQCCFCCFALSVKTFYTSLHYIMCVYYVYQNKWWLMGKKMTQNGSLSNSKSSDAVPTLCNRTIKHTTFSIVKCFAWIHLPPCTGASETWNYEMDFSILVKKNA